MRRLPRLWTSKHRPNRCRCRRSGTPKAIFSPRARRSSGSRRRFAERVGARHAVAVSNGTAALHVACLAAGIGPGDRGLTAAITFAASANCLRYAGAEAGFVDIDPDTLGMTPACEARRLMRMPDVRASFRCISAGLGTHLPRCAGSPRVGS